MCTVIFPCTKCTVIFPCCVQLFSHVLCVQLFSHVLSVQLFSHVLWIQLFSRCTTVIFPCTMCTVIFPCTMDSYFSLLVRKIKLSYPALVPFEQSNCIYWMNFCYIQSLTKIYFFWYIFMLSGSTKQQQYRNLTLLSNLHISICRKIFNDI